MLEKFEKSEKIKKILITSNTLSSSKIISRMKSLKRVVHQFFPVDNNFIVKKFIKHWKPSIALFVDSEIWPNMLTNLEKNKFQQYSLMQELQKNHLINGLK
jgi:3-deoxy-D-manno-octulosonic-acid transferase